MARGPSLTITDTVRRYPGPGGWYFVELSDEQSRGIRGYGEAKKVGWGYVRVRARIGETAWDTTLFPTKEGRYFLSIKADVRKKEKISEGGLVHVECVLA